MNKIYLVEFNKCDYDQYDSFVVIATNKDEVIELIKKQYVSEKIGPFIREEIDWESGYTVKEIDLGREESKGILLGSFNAG